MPLQVAEEKFLAAEQQAALVAEASAAEAMATAKEVPPLHLARQGWGNLTPGRPVRDSPAYALDSARTSF